MEINKLKGYLNIANKAGYIIWGGETLENYSKKLFLVLYDPSAQRSTQKILTKLKQNEDLKVLAVENLGQILNKPNCKMIGLKNKNLSDIIINIIEN